MASGADDGSFRIWDLRTFGGGGKKIEPVAALKWHSAPVTSVEWHPTDASVLCASGEDDQVSVWDLAVEHDAEAAGGAAMDGAGREIPPQLMFVHQGQRNVKEAHWHRQLPGVIVSTAESGMNLFKTISITH
jgi:ribosome assembly protein RRB1